MFTGIVEETGTLRRLSITPTTGEITIACKKVLEDVHIGDSISTNGVCLTVTATDGSSFRADVMPETLRRSNLGDLTLGDKVNLERAMAAGGRFGGHIVSGHIDGTGTITNLRHEGNAVWVTIQTPADILRLIVPKGSITIDGISLTVAAVGSDNFQVSIIPHTGSETTLLTKRPGNRVNLENDIVGKYVERLLNFAEPESSQPKESRITMEFLAEHGF